MMVQDAVKVLVDIVKHVHNLHGSTIVAEGGESHDVTEVDGNLFKELWLHSTRFLQGPYHRTEDGQAKMLFLINWILTTSTLSNDNNISKYLKQNLVLSLLNGLFSILLSAF